jgi:hypothetical protein
MSRSKRLNLLSNHNEDIFVPTEKKPRRRISDAAALQKIFKLMDDADEWDSDTTSSIEAIISKTGRQFRDKNLATKQFKKQLSVEDVLALYPNFALDRVQGGKAWTHPMDDGGQIIVTGVNSPLAPPAYAAEVDVGRYKKGSTGQPAEIHRGCPVIDLEKVLDKMFGF